MGYFTGARKALDSRADELHNIFQQPRKISLTFLQAGDGAAPISFSRLCVWQLAFLSLPFVSQITNRNNLQLAFFDGH